MLKRAIGIFLFLSILSGFIPSIYRSNAKIEKFEKELANLESKKKDIKVSIDYYEKEIKSLEKIENKEKVVRNKLQMVKPGEIIYRVIK